MKAIILRDIKDEQVLDKIFDAALKKGGSDVYNLVRYIETRTVLYPDAPKKEESVKVEEPAAKVEEPAKIEQPEQAGELPPIESESKPKANGKRTRK